MIQQKILSALLLIVTIFGISYSINNVARAGHNIEITNVAVSRTETSAKITWDTDVSSPSKLDYGPSNQQSYPYSGRACSGLGETPKTSHCMNLTTGIQSWDEYRFLIIADDPTLVHNSGSHQGTFQADDNTDPTVEITTPSNNATVSGASVQTQADASDDGSGIDRVEFKLGNSNLGTDSSSPYNINWDSTTFPNSSSSGDTLTVIAYDNAGNQSSDNITIHINNQEGTPSEPDTESPTAPSRLDGEPSSNSVQLSWTGSTDNTGVEGYKVFRGSAIGTNFISIADTSNLNFVNSGLASNSTYTYKVQAYDEAGNDSSFSNTVTVTTLVSGGNELPSVPQNVSAQAQSTSSIKITWDSSEDPDGSVVDYRVYRGQSEIATVTGTSYIDSSLSSETTYSYRVKARDNDGALSGFSNTSEVTTHSSEEESNDSDTTDEEIANIEDVFLRGTVRLPDGTSAANALVSIWSADSNLNLRTDSNGSFSAEVKGGVWWQLRADYVLDNIGYRSNVLTFGVRSSSINNIELSLERLTRDLPPSKKVEGPATEKTTLTLNNGATINIPENAAAAERITLEVKPTTEVPTTLAHRVVGAAYEIDVKDQANAQVRIFEENIEITFPYEELDLKELNVPVEQLRPAYYDEDAQEWIIIIDYTLDTVNKRIIANIDHLTRFALISAADITPPDAPTNVSANKVGANVELSWTNPENDFRHAKIYRSDQTGILGNVIFNEVAGNSATDTTAEPGKTYYYLVRTVDPAGNESVNIAQTATGNKSAISALTKGLKLGASGDDVKLIQQILNRDGVTVAASGAGSAGNETRFFGPRTHAAVIRFQEKYMSDILGPWGLTKGTGFVGSTTRAKLNELKAIYSL